MKRYPSPKLAARMQFTLTKNSVKIEQKYLSTKNCQYLGNGWKFLKISAVGTTFVFYKE